MRLLILLSALFCSATVELNAGSATWSTNPGSSDWNTAANWMPMTVPNGPADRATFDTSDLASITLSSDVTIAACIFNQNAVAYHIATGMNLDFSGTGVINSSTALQTFEAAAPFGDIVFSNHATIAGPVSFIANRQVGFTSFATAGNATFVVNGSDRTLAFGGSVAFNRSASPDHATFTINGGTGHGGAGGEVVISDRSTGADATFIVNGSDVAGAGGGAVSFAGGAHSGASAGNATIIVNGGTSSGGFCTFGDKADGGTARLELFGNGSLINYGGLRLSFGSIEGDASLPISGILIVGSNNLSTTYSGILSDAGPDRSSLTKIGTGVLTLSGANTYDGDTEVQDGTLLAGNDEGSATGRSRVTVSHGTLAGSGTIAGAVTIGTGSGNGVFLAPSAGSKKPVTLTLQRTLDLKADATYTYVLQAKGKKARTDKVMANGVTIESGATFDLVATFKGAASTGRRYTVISNTAATPIAGTFANLPDGSIITAGGNNLQASYEGGDGNDLTLTVVP